MQVRRIAGAKITLVPILRAGLGMLPGVLALIPSAKVSVVGLQRDEEACNRSYFERLTGRLDERDALILDPMLATGGTLIATIDMLKRAGADASGIFGRRAGRVEHWKPRIPTCRSTPRRSTRTPQRTRLHPARPRRRWRPHLRHPRRLIVPTRPVVARAAPRLRARSRNDPWHHG